jgi:DNA-binding NarL/FixJ family response regulator
MAPRVLIVDDHAPFRALARRLLAASGFDVVGEAADGASALRACAELRPGVVLLDVGLPDLDGFAVAEALTEDAEPPAVVLISSRARSDYGRRVETSAACGFVDKGELSGEAVHRLLGGSWGGVAPCSS